VLPSFRNGPTPTTLVWAAHSPCVRPRVNGVLLPRCRLTAEFNRSGLPDHASRARMLIIIIVIGEPVIAANRSAGKPLVFIEAVPIDAAPLTGGNVARPVSATCTRSRSKYHITRHDRSAYHGVIATALQQWRHAPSHAVWYILAQSTLIYLTRVIVASIIRRKQSTHLYASLFHLNRNGTKRIVPTPSAANTFRRAIHMS